MLIDHPIIFIEKLLKSGLGDKDRLLYLRNYIKSGKPLYDSDKNFLKTLQMKLDEKEYFNEDNSNDAFKPNIKFENTLDSPEFKNNISKPEEYYSSDKNNSLSTDDSGILKIQNSINELQKSNSKLKDNLELILISRHNSSPPRIEKLTPIVSSTKIIKNNVSNSIPTFKNNSNSKNVKKIGVKKHDLMAYTSAGLFSLWYAGFQNIVDLGPFQSISLGLAAAAAVSAGIFYKQQKNS